MEPKGSLFLKSNHMNYSRPTLVSNWHQARESEPKDYDISYGEVRDMSKATYKRLANITDGTIPQTTYQDLVNDHLKKPHFTEMEVRKPMVNVDTIESANIDRNTGKPSTGYGSVLPRHNPDHNKHHLETTHRADFTPPFAYKPAEFAAFGHYKGQAPFVYHYPKFRYEADVESVTKHDYVHPASMLLPTPYRPIENFYKFNPTGSGRR